MSDGGTVSDGLREDGESDGGTVSDGLREDGESEGRWSV